jgi:type I protein arginine methyltransferase
MAKYQLGRLYAAMLETLLSPRSREELIDLRRKAGENEQELARAFDALLSAGVVELSSETAQPVAYTASYAGGILDHGSMLRDYPRTNGYRMAIESIVREGDVVADVGAGTGILGFFAARAGAKKVILIENTRTIEDAKTLAAANGLDDKVEFFPGDARAFDPKERIDVIVSEWQGNFLMDEYMYAAACDVRDRCLAVGGRVVPRAARLYLAPIDDARLDYSDGFGFWEAPVYGFDYSLGGRTKLQMLKDKRMGRRTANVARESIIASPWKLMTLDCTKDTMDAFHFQSAGEFVIQRAGSVHGFAGWFELDLAPHVLLDTSPFAESTHWGQQYFFVSRFSVDKGDRMEVILTTTPGAGGPDVTIAATVVRKAKVVHSLEHTYCPAREQ